MSASGVFADPANRRALARGRRAMDEQARVFGAFATAALGAADPHEAAGLAQIAYAYANRRHPGLMCSPSLERLLNDLGRAHVPGGEERAGRGSGPERILHVTTQVYATGGHTRVVERWIERDDARRSTLLLLRQEERLPASLRRACDATGTPVVNATPGDLLERARDLRALAASHDAVVLHVSPFEVVVALAFADPAGRPPTILFNHASQHLWAGVGAVDVVASLWQLDADDAVARRGVAADRSLVLPLPATPRALPPRAAARASLGLPADAPVLLCAASPYKLDPVLEPSFHDLVATLVARLPDLHVLVAGPTPELGLVPDHPRARALGAVADIGPLLASADLLLDSWPASGATMMLDAAAAGLPCVSLGGGDASVALIRPPAGLFDGTVTNAGDLDELVAVTAELIADAPRRQALGERVRAHAARHHDEQGWRAALEEIMAAARTHAGAAAVPADVAPVAPTDSEAVLHLLSDAEQAFFTPYHAYAWSSADLPAAARPADEPDLRARVDAILAAPPAVAPRGIAAPAVTVPAIGELVADVRRRVAAAEISSCLVVVDPAEVTAAVALLEHALATGPDVDLELVGARDLRDVAAPGDVVLSA
ncbi:MAG TPA: hypothetical protein VGO71_08245 [Baekduia sp.]|nr:hypothetical protein [Baekduia sp.]